MLILAARWCGTLNRTVASRSARLETTSDLSLTVRFCYDTFSLAPVSSSVPVDVEAHRGALPSAREVPSFNPFLFSDMERLTTNSEMSSWRARGATCSLRTFLNFGVSE